MLLVAAATTTVAVAFVVPLSFVVAGLADDRARDPAEQTARGLVPIVTLAPDAPLVEAALSSADDGVEGTVALFLPDGRTLGDPPGGANPTDLAAVTEVTEREVDGDLWLLFPVTSEDGTAVVLVTVPAEARTRGVVHSWVVLGGLGLMLVTGATLLADRLARRVTEALEQVEDTAGELIAGRLEARAGVEDPPEVAAVAEALDRLASRVSSMVADARQQAADLSHRLRTPMTTLRLDIDSLPDVSARERLEADLDALEAAVDQLISDARRPEREGVGARVDLAAVAAERARFWRALAEDEGRVFEVSLPERPAIVAVTEPDAEALLDVLLDNVFTHAGAGVAVRVELSLSDGRAVLSVEDGGAGFPDASGDRRHGPRRHGPGSTGIGLDIARRTADHAGGSLVIETSDLGGAAVRVRLPVVA